MIPAFPLRQEHAEAGLVAVTLLGGAVEMIRIALEHARDRLNWRERRRDVER